MSLFDEAYKREYHDRQKNRQYQSHHYSSDHASEWSYLCVYGKGGGEKTEYNINVVTVEQKSCKKCMWNSKKLIHVPSTNPRGKAPYAVPYQYSWL